MQVAILGANGRSGRECVKACLAAGMSVRAGVHRSKTDTEQTNLEFIQFDGTDINSVIKLIDGCDVVVSLIGHTRNSPAWVQSDTTKNVLSAMQKQGINRLISLTGSGVRFAGDRPSLIDRILNFVIKLVDPKRIKDGIQHAKIIKQSNTDWTIIRVLKLTDGRTQSYHLTNGGPARLLTARATVAAVIIEILRSNQYSQTAPIISSTKHS